MSNLKLKTLTDPYKCHLCGIQSDPNNKSYRSILEIHHIVYQEHGGTNTPDNLIPLCSNHHSLVHEGKIKLNRWYSSTKGWVMHWVDVDGKEYYGTK